MDDLSLINKKRKTKKIYVTILKIVTFILIICFPFLIIFITVEKLPDQYGNTYLAELDDKYDLLCKTEEKKIVFVGGSSLPFGLRSDLIEQELPDYKVVNFGLYATLGTKLMMDLSKSNINQGDIVILSPELSEQTYSLYFNPESVLQACDGFTFKYKYLSLSNNIDLFYNYYKFAFDKINYSSKGTAPDPVGIYRHDSFNEYGDIKVDRPNNIMNNGFDSTMKIKTTDALLDKDFINYVNDYCEYVRSRKAKIYFNFSPCNELAIATSKAKRTEFQNMLNLNIECDLLSDLEDCIINYGYFYDTNFHLNSAGSIFYTNLLVNNIKSKLGIKVQGADVPDDPDKPENPDNPSIIVPDPPEIPGGEVVEPPERDDLTPFEEYRGEPNNDYIDYFEYRLVGTSYQIIGVKNEYLDMEEVILPSTYNGKNITTIAENALYGCINLKKIYIGNTYKTLEARAFNGCIGLEGIYFYAIDGNTISPPSTMLLDGASKNVKIFIPAESKGSYTSGYTWEHYSEYFEYFLIFIFFLRRSIIV